MISPILRVFFCTGVNKSSHLITKIYQLKSSKAKQEIATHKTNTPTVIIQYTYTQSLTQHMHAHTFSHIKKYKRKNTRKGHKTINKVKGDKDSRRVDLYRLRMVSFVCLFCLC